MHVPTSFPGWSAGSLDAPCEPHPSAVITDNRAHATLAASSRAPRRAQGRRRTAPHRAAPHRTAPLVVHWPVHLHGSTAAIPRARVPDIEDSPHPLPGPLGTCKAKTEGQRELATVDGAHWSQCIPGSSPMSRIPRVPGCSGATSRRFQRGPVRPPAFPGPTRNWSLAERAGTVPLRPTGQLRGGRLRW